MKYLQAFTFLILLCAGTLTLAQTGYDNGGSRSDAMGNASLCIEDVFSVQNNQAAIAATEHTEAGVAIHNYYADNTLNSLSAVVAVPTGSGVFGASLNYYGYSDFSQTRAGVAYGRKLGKSLSAGIQLDYIGTRISEFGSGSAFTFEAGLLYAPVENLYIGARVYNPLRVKNGLEVPEDLPSLFDIGFNWHPSDKVILAIEAEQEPDQPLRIKTGLEYGLLDALFVRCGYVSYPSMFTAGLGLGLHNFSIDISSQFHPQLGISPGLGLRYQF